MAFGNGPKIVTDGLVFALDAGDKNSYIGTGTSWKDISGNGITQTLNNGTTYSSTNGGSMVFDGVDDWCNGPSFTLSSPTNSLSFNFWVKMTGSTSQSQLFIAKDGYGFPHLLIARVPSSDNIRFNWEAGPTQISGFFTGTNNLWTNIQITVSYGATSPATFYKNGIYYAVDNGGTQNFPYTNSSLDIGGRGYGFWLTGNVSIVQIYNKVLSATEVLQNYNALKSRFNLN
jgi:hypothetical protein